MPGKRVNFFVLCSRVLLMATQLVADVEHKMAGVGSL